MQSVFDELVDLRACSGSKEKIAFLKKCSPDFQKYLEYVLDPYRMYGIKSYPLNRFQEEYQQPSEIDSLWYLLDKLHARELTGHAAGDACMQWEKIGGIRELLVCALNKDLRAGVQATSVNKAIPGLIPEFKVSLAEEYDSNRIVFPCWVSTKYDGLRALTFVDRVAKTVDFKTRNGLEIPAVSEELKQDVLRLLEGHPDYISKKIVLDGEILTGDFQESVSALRKKSKTADEGKYYVFDILDHKTFIERGISPPQYLRTREVDILFRGFESQKLFRVDEVMCFNNEEVLAAYQDRISRGFEGLIIKDSNSPYQFRRSYSWTKLKEIKTYDLKITGVERGLGKYSDTLGALIGDYNGVAVRVAGMTDMQRNNFWANPPIDSTMEVLAQGETKDGSLRHPRFVKIRMDK